MPDSEDTMRELAEEIATDLQYENYELKLKPISTEGANYTTDLFVGTISAPGKENIEIFGKVANVGEEMRKKMPIDEIYNVERYFYTDLLKKYEKLQEKYNVPQEHRIKTAKYYTSTCELYKETLVLENLIAKGYTLYDRFKSVDWEYASKAIEELAKLHALSVAHAQENPEDFEKIAAEMKPKMDINLMGELMTDAALNAVDESNRDKLDRFLREILQNTSKYFIPVRHPVLVHGDYRQSNLMHKETSDGKLEVVIVDFQLLQAGCPITDLMYFIFTGTDGEFRLRYYDKLVEHYYSQLCLALHRLHVDPEKVYPREDFEYELKEMLPFGLITAAYILQIVTVESDNAPKMDGELTTLNMKTSDLYSKRLNDIVNDYIEWGIL